MKDKDKDKEKCNDKEKDNDKDKDRDKEDFMLGQCNSWLKKHVNTMMIWKVTIK